VHPHAAACNLQAAALSTAHCPRAIVLQIAIACEAQEPIAVSLQLEIVLHGQLQCMGNCTPIVVSFHLQLGHFIECCNGSLSILPIAQAIALQHGPSIALQLWFRFIVALGFSELQLAPHGQLQCDRICTLIAVSFHISTWKLHSTGNCDACAIAFHGQLYSTGQLHSNCNVVS
jgi:hypothetical protein